MASPFANFVAFFREPQPHEGDTIATLLQSDAAIERGLAELQRQFEAGTLAPEPPPTSKREVIRRAMAGNEMLEFTYTRRDGATGSYAVEPYERAPQPQTGEEGLYAFHPVHGSIHFFRWSAIQAPAVIEGAEFSPRWEVQTDTV